jgi:hypothetical protein
VGGEKGAWHREQSLAEASWLLTRAWLFERVPGETRRLLVVKASTAIATATIATPIQQARNLPRRRAGKRYALLWFGVPKVGFRAMQPQ